jgi:hypothetical protein
MYKSVCIVYTGGVIVNAALFGIATWQPNRSKFFYSHWCRNVWKEAVKWPMTFAFPVYITLDQEAREKIRAIDRQVEESYLRKEASLLRMEAILLEQKASLDEHE